MLNNVSSSIFTDSSSVEMVPVVSAEWNQNLFNQPYLTVAGNGTNIASSATVHTGYTVSSVTDSHKHPTFTTKSFITTDGAGSVKYDITGSGANAYKIVTYVKTDSVVPIMINAYAKGTSTQFGSNSIDANSFGWTQLVVYMGSSGVDDTIDDTFNFNIVVNRYSSANDSPTIYYTVPEVYETTFFDYQNDSLYPTDSPFSFLRPGESYVFTGNSYIQIPSNYRRISSQVLGSETLSGGFYGNKYMPISPIVQNPSSVVISGAGPIFKNAVPSDMSPYKYFISDTTSKKITALYEKDLTVNKLVLKFNSIMTVPTVNIALDGTNISVDGSTSVTPDSNGLLVIYWNGTSWTKNRWSVMPTFSQFTAELSTYTTMKKISVTQVSKTNTTKFQTYSNTYLLTDMTRMHLIEVSPRLEIDLSDYVVDVSINKSLDSKNNYVPISSINSNDASVTLSGIPISVSDSPVALFSNQSTLSSSVLKNMLRKNIKIYISFNLKSYSNASSNTTTVTNDYIPGGVFYSDVWDEKDISSVTVQAYDVTRYLQSMPVPDYVSNLKSVFDIITTILDLAGYTDYDYDSLSEVCNSNTMPLDLAYYYCNSKDTTVIEALSQIFLAYQIGAYIDEYNVMNFLSLSKILSPKEKDISINDSMITQGGYSISNKAKLGKISLRYQSPKIAQSLSLENATDPAIRNSQSFIYTSKNDTPWMQQSIDAVGFNYLDYSNTSNYAGVLETENKFKVNASDLLDHFHSFDLSSNGYAVIENEIVSFVYKEYKLTSGSNIEYVSVKNSLELNSEINKFTKKYEVQLVQSSAVVTAATADGSTITYTAENNFKVDQSVTVYDIYPFAYNTTGTIIAANDSSFSIASTLNPDPASDQSGKATISASYDMKVEFTGYITNVKRGLYGTVASDHMIMTSLSQKGLSQATVDSSYAVTTGGTNASVADSRVSMSVPSSNKLLVYPTTQKDASYSTYSTKFNLANISTSASGIFFNAPTNMDSMANSYFVEMIKYNKTDPSTSSPYSPAQYEYLIAIYQLVDGAESLIAYAEITSSVVAMMDSFVKAFSGNFIDGYTISTNDPFHLKVVHYPSEDGDGETSGELIMVFLNNVEIKNWQVPGTAYNSGTAPLATGWQALDLNTATKMQKKVSLPTAIMGGTTFGAYMSTKPVTLPSKTYSTISSTTTAGNLREIYGTKKALKEKSVNYYFQDREFLNGMIQNQNMFLNSPSYMMQSIPEVVGINVYDVQYTTPAAVSVDVLPVTYTMYYYLTSNPADTSEAIKQIVDQYELSYSTILNTGFRARMAIVNNANYLIYLNHQADQAAEFTTNLVLWTHEIIAPSDPEIIESIVDKANISETAQIDTQWIQSKEAAYKMLSVIEKGLDGFSKDVSVTVFGNPLIQVGDIVGLTYPLAGITAEQKYVVHSVSNSFSQGLTTTLVLNQVG